LNNDQFLMLFCMPVMNPKLLLPQICRHFIFLHSTPYLNQAHAIQEQQLQGRT